MVSKFDVKLDQVALTCTGSWLQHCLMKGFKIVYLNYELTVIDSIENNLMWINARTFCQ